MRTLQAGWLVLVLLAGCAALGVPPADTYNKQLAGAYTAVTAARQETLTLLQAGKITADDAQNVQNQADAIRAGLDVSAVAFKGGDSAAATTKLDSTITVLKALQSYLLIKKGG